MEIKFHNHSFITPRCSSSTSRKGIIPLKNVGQLNYVPRSHGFPRIGSSLRSYHRLRRLGHFVPFASGEDGVTVNGSVRGSLGKDDGDYVEEIRFDLNRSLQENEDFSDGLVQSLHEAARVFELAIKERGSFSRISWFLAAWLGVDRNAWVKTLSYQASVYSLLQAVVEISSRGDGSNKDTRVFVQRSILRLSAPLESLIRDKLLAKQPETSEWFWSKLVPGVVTSFTNHLEDFPNFVASTSSFVKDMSVSSCNASDISLLGLSLTCIAAVTKIGPAKVSCSQFFSSTPEISGRMMDILVGLIPIRRAYHYIKDIGLHREFLRHFGPRAAACRVTNDQDSEEVIFWVDLIQRQLRQAIDRERIWSKLTTSESIEVLERDLAIFGFFIALSRCTQSFLFANGFDVIDEPLEGFIRYLIGGSVLYYPQLSSISSYQLYVEVVSEELDWLPFYPGVPKTSKQLHSHKSNHENPPSAAEAIPQVLDVCSHWMQSFIKYSKWLKNPSNVKASRFLSRGHIKLMECEGQIRKLRNCIEVNSTARVVEMSGIGSYSSTEKESDSFDKALESVEEALTRLESLLQELHVSSPHSEKENLKAACSDLEKIRKLKKEAEFLQASFRAKAASYQQADDDIDSLPSDIDHQQYTKGGASKRVNVSADKRKRPHGLWSFFARRPVTKSTMEPSIEENCIEQATLEVGVENSDQTDKIQRFELLRSELLELEKRVERSSIKSKKEEDAYSVNDNAKYMTGAEENQLVQVEKKESAIEKSLSKMREASMDVWQGTQLLAIDVGAARGLLRRVLIGDELTQKETKALQRTLTDLALVVPIGVLMLLPVTAVGHAAMLAAIKSYVPALIPSTYGAERLNLLRQLEKVKEMETSDVNPEDNVEEMV